MSNHFLPTIVTLPMDAEPACAGMWALFDSTDPADHAAAKRICATCDLVATCGQIAANQRDSATGRLAIEGTWAGELHGDDRNAYRRARNEARNIQPCGTRAGYLTHTRDGEQPCDECREFDQQRQRELRARRKGEAA